MSRVFHIPGIVFLFFAFVLLFLVSISLPYLTAIDFVRIHAQTGGPSIGDTAIDELRVSLGVPPTFGRSTRTN